MVSKQITILKTLLCIIILIVSTNGYGGSFYSTKGIGYLWYFPNGQAMGMGGIGLAIADRVTFNHINPATMAFIDVTRISGSFIYEGVSSRRGDEEGFSSYANAHAVKFSLPIYRNMSLALGLTPLSMVHFKFSSSGNLQGTSYEKSVEGTGGLNQVFFGLGTRVVKSIYAGLTFNFNFGKIDESWKVNYYEFFNDSRDVISTKLWGWNATAGILVKLTENWSLGGGYTNSVNLHTKTNLTYVFGKRSEMIRSRLKLPYAWGVGSSYRLAQKLLLSANFYTQNWEDFQLNYTHLSGYRDMDIIALGGEFVPSSNVLASYFKRIAYRAGFSMRTLYVRDSEGDEITEQFATLGLGLPFLKNSGRIDIALMYGKRGTYPKNPVEENLLQLLITITGGEKWFVRPR